MSEVTSDLMLNSFFVAQANKAIKRRIHQFFNGHLMLYSRHLFGKYINGTIQGAQRHEIYLQVPN